MQKINRKLIVLLVCVIVVLGFVVRFYDITADRFFYYDEGLYLEHAIEFLVFMDARPFKDFATFWNYFTITFHLALAEGKALWFFICSLRSFFLSYDAWWWNKLISAIFGSLTLGMVYLFAKRFYNSKAIGLLSLGILALLPSHVFYSRLGLQEGFSTFLFLSGIYLYLIPRRFLINAVLSGAVLSCVFFVNYRMIFIPAILAFVELYMSFAERRHPHYRKFVWMSITFFYVVFLIGNLDNGANTQIAFAWMFYQAHLAKESFDIVNLFSYPYYVFQLESFIFGLFFFGNIYFWIKKQWRMALPFALVCFQMIMFSFASEKGVRYLCSSFPLMVVAVAALIHYLYKTYQHKFVKYGVPGLVGVMFICHMVNVWGIVQFSEDYKTSMVELRKADQEVKVVSTQKLIQKMYSFDREYVYAVPNHAVYLPILYKRGFRYLIVGPQAFISYTRDSLRFSQKLKNYLGFIYKNLEPDYTYDHFNEAMLKRFVFEHSTNLRRSIAFLKASKKDGGNYGQLKVYSIERCLITVRKIKEIMRARSAGMNIK